MPGMQRRKTTQAAITHEQFRELTLPMIGLPVSRAWRGYSSALFLEIGVLTEEIIPGRVDSPKVSQVGQFGISLNWHWRVERPRSIYFGSMDDDKAIDAKLGKLQQATIRAVDVEGRLPELAVQLSNGLYVRSFAMAEGQPEWCMFLNTRGSPLSWLASERGRLVRETEGT
jgi:hypothetical protein